MAEAFLRHSGCDRFAVESAGLQPGTLNPLAVDVMREVGIDISHNKIKDILKFFKEGHLYDYVISVCDEASAERCPVFPGVTKRLHWSFQDPSLLEGNYSERLNKTRLIRDELKKRVEAFIREVKHI
jgi:arsenate reductase